MYTSPIVSVITFLVLGCLPCFAITNALGGQAQQGDRRSGKTTVAVLEPSANEQVGAATKGKLRTALEETFSDSPNYVVVNRASLDKVLADNRISGRRVVGGLPDEKGIAQIGNLTNANFILTSDLYRDGGYYSLTCGLIDVGTGETKTASDFVNDTQKEISRVARALVSQLLGDSNAILDGTAAKVVGSARLAAKEAQARAMAESREPDLKVLSEAEEFARLAAKESELALKNAMVEARKAEINTATLLATKVVSIAAAKEAVDRLEPYFVFEKRAWPSSCINMELTQLADRQRQAVIAKKAETGYALVASIDQGRLCASSKYTYRGGINKLSHNKLVITVNGESRTSRLQPTRNVISAGIGLGIEEAEVSDTGILYFIASAGASPVKVQIEDDAGFFKGFTMSDTAKQAIAQTVELYEALYLLRGDAANGVR